MSGGQVKYSMLVYFSLTRTSYLVTGQVKILMDLPGGQVKNFRFFYPCNDSKHSSGNLLVSPHLLHHKYGLSKKVASHIPVNSHAFGVRLAHFSSGSHALQNFKVDRYALIKGRNQDFLHCLNFYHQGASPEGFASCQDGAGLDLIVVSVSAAHAVGRRFMLWRGHTNDHHKMVQTASLLGMKALG